LVEEEKDAGCARCLLDSTQAAAAWLACHGAHGGVRFLLLLRARRIQALKAEDSAELIHCNACFTDAFMSYLLTSNLIQPHS